MLQRSFQWPYFRKKINKNLFLVTYVGFQVAEKEHMYVLLHWIQLILLDFNSLQVLYLLYIWGTYCVDGRQKARSSPTDHWIVFLHFVQWGGLCFIWVVVVRGFCDLFILDHFTAEDTARFGRLNIIVLH